MKRLNPATNQPFKRGDVREDGRVFKCYTTTRLKEDGYFIENWNTPESIKRYLKGMKEAQKIWYKQNAEHIKQKATARNKANPDKVRETNAKYREKNREKRNAANREWNKHNQDIKTALEAKRRAAKLQRTPTWLTDNHHDQMKAMYATAKQLEQQYNEKMHVDHIVPLVNKRVSGLHVPWNLQVITWKENLEKSNKFDI